jgi:cation-transporting ATPase 13A3/4/5
LTDAKNATKFIIIDDVGVCHTCEKEKVILSGQPFEYFEFKRLRYRFDEKRKKFLPIRYNPAKPFSYYHEIVVNGNNPKHLEDLLVLNGINSIEVPVTPLYKLLLDEGLHPFVVFQIFSIIVWCLYEYYYYSAVIFVISVVSIIITIITTRSNMTNLKNMTTFDSKVTVIRNGKKSIIFSKQIVPGDVFMVRSQTTVPCDALLLSGNCLVNEMMLTGESIPVIKSALPFVPPKEGKKENLEDNTSCYDYYLRAYSEPDRKTEISEVLNTDRDKVHLLYGGTKVVRARNGKLKKEAETGEEEGDTKFVVCLAVRTAFSTAKGQLVRSILYPRPTRFKFYEDSFKFIGVLALLALLGFVVNAVIQALNNEEPLYIILKAGDLGMF